MSDARCSRCGSDFGATLTSCRCGWTAIDPMPRKDVVLPPPAGYVRADHYEALQSGAARLEAQLDHAMALAEEAQEHAQIAQSRWESVRDKALDDAADMMKLHFVLSDEDVESGVSWQANVGEFAAASILLMKSTAPGDGGEDE